MTPFDVKTSESARHSNLGTYYLRLAHAEYGSLETEKLSRLRNLLAYLAAHRVAQRLVLDLADVEFFGAGFVGVLVDTWALLNQAGHRLVIWGLNPYSARLIRSMHLDKLFEIDSSQGAALESMRQRFVNVGQPARNGSVQVRLTEVAWDPDLVREEFFADDGVPIRSIIRPRERNAMAR
jgi:anti-anti-sigma factor